jgi:hypothetical protein
MELTDSKGGVAIRVAVKAEAPKFIPVPGRIIWPGCVRLRNRPRPKQPK